MPPTPTLFELIGDRSGKQETYNEANTRLLTILHEGAMKIVHGGEKSVSFETVYRSAYHLCTLNQNHLVHVYLDAWLRYAISRTNTDRFKKVVVLMDDIAMFWRHGYGIAMLKTMGVGVKDADMSSFRHSYVKRMARAMKVVLALDKHWIDRVRPAFLHWFFRAAPLAMAPGGKARKRDRERYESEVAFEKIEI